MAFKKKKDGSSGGKSREEREAEREARKAEHEARREARRSGRGKGKGDDDTAGEKPGKSVGANRNRKDESIIRETVFETAMSSMRGNKPFCVQRDGEDLCVGILLQLAKIGGLTGKDKNDESKGSIITLINNGAIASLYTSELKSEDSIVFIPTVDTLNQMSEFYLLADDIEYELVLISPSDETIEHTGVNVSLDYLIKLHKSKGSIKAKLGDILEDAAPEGQEPVPYVAPPEPTLEPARGQAGADDPFGPDDTGSGSDGDYGLGGDVPPDLDDGDDGDDEDGEDPTASDLDLQDAAGQGQAAQPDAGYAPAQEQPQAPPPPPEPVYVSPEQSMQAMHRKFFNDDMSRDLDTSALEQALAGIGQFRALLLRPEGTWLNEQLNVLIDLANQELYALHEQNLSVVRNQYLTEIGAAYIEEMSAVGDYQADERYATIKAKVDAAMAGIDAMIEEERTKLQAEWDEKVRNAGEAARIHAEQTYRERYLYQHEERMRSIDSEMRAGAQAGELNAIADLKKARMIEAEQRLDLRDSAIIARVVDEYRELLIAETELYRRHESTILKFLDENRANEIARIQVLGKDLDRDDQIAQIQAEYQTRAASMTAEFESRISALQSDIESARVRYAQELSEKDAKYRELQAKYDSDRAEWREQVRDLTDEVGRITEANRRDTDIRVAEIKAQRDSYSDKYDHLVAMQRKGNMLIIAIAVVACLLMFAVGMLLGGGLGGKSDKAPADNPSGIQADVNLGQGDSGEAGASDPSNEVQGNPGAQAPDDNTLDTSGDDSQSPADEQWAAMQDPPLAS